LTELGWTDGRNVRTEERWAAGSEDRRRAYAAELVRLNPDVILGVSTPPVAALRQATRTIPIVFVNANNPVGSGFVESLARPGGNITGFISFEPALGGKWMETLKEIAPATTRIALVHNPRTHTGQYFQAIESAGRSLAVKPIRVVYRDAAEVERALDEFAREPGGALLVLPDSTNILLRETIVKLAVRHRLPGLYTQRLFVASGGLAHYGPSTTDLYRQAGDYVDRILKGEKPADLPVQAPTKFELVINLKAAKAIGLEILPLLLARADEVIE
jgi:putative ABC transport system substrate-binding protein